MSVDNPLISIVIPAYNYGRFLGASINSILEQTYENWELLVINNGSTDNTAEVLDQFDDKRIIKLKIDVNDGPVKAWAMGYQLSRGEFFALLPADDMFTPKKLERQVEYLRQHPDIDCLGTYIDVVDDDGLPTYDDFWMVDYINREVDYTDLAEWRWKHHFCIPTALYRKSLCDKAGGIPLDGLTNICDWDFHIRLLGVGAKFHVIPECLTRYRWHQNNTSRSRGTAHNQWMYSHTMSFIPMLQQRGIDTYGEVGKAIETLYRQQPPSFFLEETPKLWRCAHLEALLNPTSAMANFADYHEFRKYTEEWKIDSENRAAISAIDDILMELRSFQGKHGKRLPFVPRMIRSAKKRVRRLIQATRRATQIMQPATTKPTAPAATLPKRKAA